jgi:hypothetical protein
MRPPLEVMVASDILANQRDKGAEVGSESLECVAADRSDLAVGYRITGASDGILANQGHLSNGVNWGEDVVLAARVLEHQTNGIPSPRFGSIRLNMRQT